MIRLVTDSGSQITAELRQRFSIEVAPMGVIVDGAVHREGVDLDIGEFYARMAAGAHVSTSAPSPGDLLAAYERAADDGATEIVSIHTGSNMSATVSAASVAARLTPVPVHVVDTAVASFPVSLCVWAAAEALIAGADVGQVVAAAHAAAASAGSAFVVGVAERAVEGGRFASVAELSEMSVLQLAPSGVSELVKARSLERAIDAMVSHVGPLVQQQPMRLAVGDAQRTELGDLLAARLDAVIGAAELVRYDIGPSVGVHTGAGSIGVVWCAVP